MPAGVSKSQTPAERKRRLHVKSRNGCGNCKLRRVKCDEQHPGCNKCRLYGVFCDYSGSEALDLSVQASFQVECTPLGNAFISPTKVPPMSINSSIAAMVDVSLQSGSSSTLFWHFSESHLETMARFHDRTALTIGSKQMAPVYRDIVCQLAHTHAFLMHMLLSLTLMHDAELSLSCSPSLATKQKHASLQHWNTATGLFNRILADPIPPSYQDAIWATGIFLGAASFWYVESTSVENVWPLKPGDPSDLTWLRLGEGKRHLQRIADPTRPESLFSAMFKDKSRTNLSDWMETNNTSRISSRVKKVFNITLDSTSTNNVYYLPVLILSRIQTMRFTQENTLKSLYVTTSVRPEFLMLLEDKDPRAVFILAWWFTMLKDGELWWMARRAKVEGEAARIWLQREDPGLAELLESLARDAVVIDVITTEPQLPEPTWVRPWEASLPTIEAN